MGADLEQLPSPGDLIPAGPLVLTRRLISAMGLVPANRPLPACRLVPPLRLVQASGRLQHPSERTCSRAAGRGRRWPINRPPQSMLLAPSQASPLAIGFQRMRSGRTQQSFLGAV
jgi:hypothetical protein